MGRKIIPKKKAKTLEEINEPMYLQVTNGALRFEIVPDKKLFPDKEKIILTRSHPRVLIEDKKLLRWVVDNVVGVTLTRMAEKEFNDWCRTKVLPYVELDILRKDAEKYQYNSDEELKIRKKLIDEGHIDLQKEQNEDIIPDDNPDENFDDDTSLEEILENNIPDDITIDNEDDNSQEDDNVEIDFDINAPDINMNDESNQESNQESNEEIVEEEINEETTQINDEDSNDKININAPVLKLIKTYGNFGRVKPQMLYDFCKLNGPFESVDELKALDFVGPKLLERLKEVCIV